MGRGCDSTGVGQSGCNDEDPDDGDGHGTHVAGIAWEQEIPVV